MPQTGPHKRIVEITGEHIQINCSCSKFYYEEKIEDHMEAYRAWVLHLRISHGL